MEYSTELNNCDGSNADIIANTQCEVLVTTLMVAPFSLPYGSSIYAKVIAYNVYGESQISDAGNGGMIYTNPDAPVDIYEVVSQRTSSSISFTWSEGYSDGGSPVLDYRISFDDAIGSWAVLEDAVTYRLYSA